MKYLVTGGAGFIGSNLTEALLKKGHQVTVIDDLSTGSLKNLSPFFNKIKFIKSPVMNVLEKNELKKLDGIFHIGIPSTTKLYRQDRLLVGKTINEFIKVLELAKREKCKLIYASSSSVYNGNKPPFKEDLPVLVKDFYTETRFSIERLAKAYNDFYGVKSIGFRFFSVYGPREEAKKDFANLVSQFLWGMKKGKPPIIYGTGKQTRDFTYIGDIVHGLVLGMKSNIDCDILNLGTKKCYTLNELVGILNKALNTNIKPVYVKNPLKNYVYETLADTTKAKRKLGFEAKTPLKKGIQLLIAQK